MPPVKNNIPTLVCQTCGKNYYHYDKKRRFCTRACYGKAQSKEMAGPNHYNWKGGVSFDAVGRLMINGAGKKYEYTVIAEKALGKPLPKKALVHHVDGNFTNNTNSNLVICEDQAYHMLIHRRERILKAGGNPNTDAICGRCKVVKHIDFFYTQKSARKAGQPTSYCKECCSYVDSIRPPRVPKIKEVEWVA